MLRMVPLLLRNAYESLVPGRNYPPQILPRMGRGTMRSMGEGQALVILIFWLSDTLNVPLHRLRRSPSPCRGGIRIPATNAITPK
jgi:hypothetical protein